MPRQSRAVIAPAKGAPVEVVTIEVPDPGPGEAVVKVLACGVCHTDLHYKEGGIGEDFPYLLGHEAAGIVEEVGPGVGEVAPGDYVILNWRAVCGQCRACAKGKAQYCFSTHNATQKMTIADGENAGTELLPRAGHRRVHRLHARRGRSVHQGRSSRRPGGRGPARLRCHGRARRGDQHRWGRAGRLDRRHRLRRRRHGRDRRGTSGRGEPDHRRRRRPAEAGQGAQLGATHVVNGREVDVVEAVQKLTGGNGADVVVDAVGRPETWKQAFYARDLAGTVVLVGVPTPDMTIPEIPLLDVFGRGGALKSSWYGDCLPSRDFPMLIDLYLQGRLPLEAFVSETTTIDGVEAAFEKMHHGDVLRSVVTL